MGEPAMDARGIANRGTASRRAAVPLLPPADYPPFSLQLLGLGGAANIPTALAYGLKWHLELMRTKDAISAKELADDLITLWEWLKEMEVTSPRARDGTMLVNDPLATFANAKAEIEFRELASGEVVPVTRSYAEAPKPVWQPLLFPPELPPQVKANYPARPLAVDDLPPFYPEVVSKWMLSSVRGEEDESPAPPPKPEPGETGKLVESFEVLQPPSEIKNDEDAAEKAMQAAARKFDTERWTVERLEAFKGHTPTVNAALARLSSTNLNDITRHTGVKFDPAYADVPLIRNTEFILYHSVCSFVLDTNGEPFDLRLSREGEGMIDYPILIEGPGETMKRSVPADDGVYVSVQKYGFGKFRLNDAGITKLLFGTVGGFTTYGYGYSGPHRIHTTLQSYLDRGGSYGFVAAVTVPGVYTREEITWSRIRERIPQFADVLIPYLVKEIGKRASYKLENWEEFVTEVLTEVVKKIILDNIKDKVRNYIIKTVGKRIVPGLNAVAALVDLFTGGEERTRVRNILACMIVSLQSNSEEDMHIAAKTCAMVVADEFEEAVMDALVEHSAKGVSKLGKRSKTQRDADEKAAHDKPRPKEAPPPTPPPPASADTPPPKVDVPAPSSPPTKPNKVAQPADVAKRGAPQSLGAPMRNDGGAQDVNASTKTPDKSAPEVGKVQPEVTVIPKRATETERKQMRRWHEKQREHEERVARRRRELEEEERAKQEQQEQQKAAAGGGDAGAGSGSTGTADKGKSNESKGTDDKGTEATSSGSTPPDAGAPENPQRTRRPPRPFKPLSPDDEGRIHVKEPEIPEDSHAIQGEGHIRTGAHSNPAVGRSEFEKKGGAMGIGEQAHHGRQSRGAGDAGQAARDNAETGGRGGTVNRASNITPAMGLNEDHRAVHGSSAAHSSMHGPEDAETMRQMAETRRDDPEGLASAEADFTSALYEGKRPKRDTFYLGGDPDPPPKRRKESDEPPEPKDPEPKK